jgi:hypothetical protein
VQTETGIHERTCSYDPDDTPSELHKLIAGSSPQSHREIGAFLITYDNFARRFETFLIKNFAYRKTGYEPIKPEPEMAAWCRVLAAAAEHYADALETDNH